MIHAQTTIPQAPGDGWAYRYEGPDPLIIHTREGDMTAMPGDWIITGVAGETYPCKPDIFALTYERVDA